MDRAERSTWLSRDDSRPQLRLILGRSRRIYVRSFAALRMKQSTGCGQLKMKQSTGCGQHGSVGVMMVIGAFGVAVLVGDVPECAQLVRDQGEAVLAHDQHLGAVGRFEHRWR